MRDRAAPDRVVRSDRAVPPALWHPAVAPDRAVPALLLSIPAPGLVGLRERAERAEPVQWPAPMRPRAAAVRVGLLEGRATRERAVQAPRPEPRVL